MICPRCMSEQPDATECIKCGVIVEKYLIANYDKEPAYNGIHDPTRPIPIDPAIIEMSKKHVRVTSTYKLFLAVFILVLGITAGAIFINDYITRDTIKSHVTQMLNSKFRHEFHGNVIAKDVSLICKKNRVFVAAEDIIVEYLPDTPPITDGSINYIISVTVPYEIDFFNIMLPSKMNVAYHDSIEDDGNVRMMKFKEVLGLY